MKSRDEKAHALYLKATLYRQPQALFHQVEEAGVAHLLEALVLQEGEGVQVYELQEVAEEVVLLPQVGVGEGEQDL